MKTLAKNPEKAAFVRSLVVEYACDTLCSRRATNYLLRGLINMDSLSDFRVRWHYPEEQMMVGLDKILWSVSSCVKL